KNEEPIVSPTPTQEPTPSPTPTPTPTVDTKGKPIVNTADPIMPFVGLFAISMISVLAISLKRRID
ncbi:MAG: hypothetical protein IJ875_06375, partial [Solobacterium sp.]|nr:hypothetical protein [Solobacterium sp.]